MVTSISLVKCYKNIYGSHLELINDFNSFNIHCIKYSHSYSNTATKKNYEFSEQVECKIIQIQQ